MAGRQGKKLKNELRTPVPSEPNGRAFDRSLFSLSIVPRVHRIAFNPFIRHVVCVSTRHHLMVILSSLQAA